MIDGGFLPRATVRHRRRLCAKCRFPEIRSRTPRVHLTARLPNHSECTLRLVESSFSFVEFGALYFRLGLNRKAHCSYLFTLHDHTITNALYAVARHGVGSGGSDMRAFSVGQYGGICRR